MTLPPEDEFGTDDIDLEGAFVHPIEHYLGFGRRDTFERWVGEYDIVEYELRKLVNLLLRSNPNILSVLWLPRERVLVSSPAYEALIANRDISASKAVYDSFCGYATGSYGGVTRLVENNPEHDREMEALNAEIPAPPGHGAGARTRQPRSRPLPGLVPQEAQEALQRPAWYLGYVGKEAAERREVRLRREAWRSRPTPPEDGCGVSAYGTIQCGQERHGCGAAQGHQRGRCPLERVQAESERLFAQAEAALASSTLPERPDCDRAEALLVGMLREHFGEGF